MLLRCLSKKYYFIALLLAFSVQGFAQRITHGIVVDSLTLTPLQGVHVKVKNSNKGTVTNDKGDFNITTTPVDTLILSRVGYVDLQLPLLFEEADILIRLRERVRMLKEITISSTRLAPSEIVRTTRTAPRKMSTADAFSSPWEYFNRSQRDKRKVVKLINENNRVKTYVEVVHDQLLREEIMDEMGLTETEFYSTLAEFNKQSQDILYSTDKHEIITSMKSFFKMRVR
ncbi:carboxypeptidase-like regulatory domain-containing protein [Chryseolinea sp. H1M3-3]|uniref:carboxypeptidase-like regulatory domain-containing protein n=1 Tax=Chryseolinea sp. H1M3-3 TaxID=3034144 RepID=UPI0023EAA60D|nr:carboxypeptidase-like regulatory domain-containing protein [Chryseolinea sp. H1M3-3]